MFEVNDPRLEVEAFGVKFQNPIGMAAGYDKNGVAVNGLSALGFGHIEVGTVTRQKQIGNPKPRVQRVIEAQGVINSMGFPNSGVDALKIERGEAKPWASTSARAKTRRSSGRLKITGVVQASVSTRRLRGDQHQQPQYLEFAAIAGARFDRRFVEASGAVRDSLLPRVPVLVKIAPDLSEAEIDDVLGAISLAGVDGIIATNTTIGRRGFRSGIVI